MPILYVGGSDDSTVPPASLEAFYAETCAKHGACPTDEIKMVQSQLCPGVVGVMCLSLFATLFDKEKPKQA